MKTLKSILDTIAEAKQTRTVVKKLQENECFELKSILQANYNPNISFPFPAGTPPYEPREDEVEITKDHIQKLGPMVTNNQRIRLVEKEMALISLLESVSAEDAKIIIAMKDGELEELYPKITEEVVRKAFPKLLP